jgi:hypothetical protein
MHFGLGLVWHFAHLEPHNSSRLDLQDGLGGTWVKSSAPRIDATQVATW